MRGVWELMVACKGSVVVAWRRGGLRTRLVCVLAAVAMVGAAGGLWLLAGDDGAGQDAAAPGNRFATQYRSDGSGAVAGRRHTGPTAPAQPGSPGSGSAKAAGNPPKSDTEASRAVVPGAGARTVESSARPHWTAMATPDRGASPSPSAPTTIAPAPSQPGAGAGSTTTTTAEAPPTEGSGTGGSGGLLGGVLDLLGIG